MSERQCDTCDRLVAPQEEGRCAFCRMRERGDNRLLAHPYLEPGMKAEPLSWLELFLRRHRSSA